MNSLVRLGAALMFAGALAGACQAQDQQSDPSQGGGQGGGHGGGRGAVRAACQADIAKLCSGDSDGRGAFRCLRDHQDAVSDSCKSAMETARAHRREHGGGGPDAAGAPQN
jgi:hypothetical protein